MDSHRPGTLFRIFSADKSKHYTAVLLKSGKLFEVKNPDGSCGAIFDSLDAFCEAHSMPDSSVEITNRESEKKERKRKRDEEDAAKGHKKSKMKRIRPPKKKCASTYWLHWCYSILKECAPELLTEKSVVEAYYGLADLCLIYSDDIGTHYIYSRRNRYSVHYLRHEPQTSWKGLDMFFMNELYSYNRPASTPKNYAEMRDKLTTAYVSLYELIESRVRPYLKKVNQIKDLDHMIKFNTRNRDKFLRSVRRLQNEIIYYNGRVSEYSNKIEELIAKREALE